MNLEEYLKINFCGIELKSPMIYRNPLAIRFELGSSIGIDSGSIDRAIFRCNEIVNYLTKDTDVFFVVNFLDVDITQPMNYFDHTVEHLFIEHIKTSFKIEKCKIPYRYEDDEDTITLRYSTECEYKYINIEKLIKNRITRNNTGESKFIGDIYLINASQNLIFHLYDHRGMDIVTNKKDVLTSIYMKYSEWVLEYDRELILSRIK